MYILRFDGLFRSVDDTENEQAGLMCYGWLIYHNMTVIARGHGGFARSHHATSNGAEYLALIEGLEALLDMGVQDQRIKVFGDAKTVIQQMQGIAGVSSPGILPLYDQAMKLAVKFSRIKWGWTPRNENKAADLLSRHALKSIHGDSSEYQAAIQAIQQNHSRAAQFMPLSDVRIYNLKAAHPLIGVVPV